MENKPKFKDQIFIYYDMNGSILHHKNSLISDSAVRLAVLKFRINTIR